jgi:hypothetical protein
VNEWKKEEPKIDDKIGQNRRESQKSRTSAGNPFEGLSDIFHLMPLSFLLQLILYNRLYTKPLI